MSPTIILKNIRCWLIGGHRMYRGTVATTPPAMWNGVQVLPDLAEVTYCSRCHPDVHRWAMDWMKRGHPAEPVACMTKGSV